jgi:hypothetical protein
MSRCPAPLRIVAPSSAPLFKSHGIRGSSHPWSRPRRFYVRGDLPIQARYIRREVAFKWRVAEPSQMRAVVSDLEDERAGSDANLSAKGRLLVLAADEGWRAAMSFQRPQQWVS